MRDIEHRGLGMTEGIPVNWQLAVRGEAHSNYLMKNWTSLVATSMARPLQLIRCTADGRFEVGEEAAEVLRALRGPLGVVAVCGRARQGKSFILNQLATHGHAAAQQEGWVPADDVDTTDSAAASGFAVAPTHRPCTKVRPPVSVLTPRARSSASRRIVQPVGM